MRYAVLGRFGLCARQSGASKQVNRVWGATRLGVQSRESKRSLQVATDSEPELRRVLGKGRRVASDQVVVARGGAGAPPAGCVCLSAAADEDPVSSSGELEGQGELVAVIA